MNKRGVVGYHAEIFEMHVVVANDIAKYHQLKKAQRIVTRNGYRRVAQFTERDTDYDVADISKALTEAGVEHFTLESRGVLSRYTDEGETPSLFVSDSASGRLTEVSAYTPLYQRFAGAVRLSRIFVRPEQLDVGKPIVAKLTGAARLSDE
jgi:hypothetical protein